jgi:hypothetical protein
VFDLQDPVAGAVAGVIEPALQAAEIECGRRKRLDSVDAYDLYLRALAELRRPSVRTRPPWFRPQDYAQILEGLRKAGWREESLWILLAAAPVLAAPGNGNGNGGVGNGNGNGNAKHVGAPAPLLGFGIPSALAIGGVLLGAKLLKRKR